MSTHRCSNRYLQTFTRCIRKGFTEKGEKSTGRDRYKEEGRTLAQTHEIAVQ